MSEANGATGPILAKAFERNGKSPDLNDLHMAGKLAEALENAVPMNELARRDDERRQGGSREQRPTLDVDALPPPSAFAARGLLLSACEGWTTEQPPPQTWLLTQWRDGREVGVLPRGKTGLLTATGGTGKTYALCQLAIAVASGTRWLDTFNVTEAGHVVLALGEEDADEVRRRLWRTWNALECSLDERQAMASRIHVLPMHGIAVALTESCAGGIRETERAVELRAWLAGLGVPLSLIILDPLSRWAGGAVETDNELATRFCQLVESLASVDGSPTVVVAHHSSQASAQAGQSNARGVTGITDGFRWRASMDAVESDGLDGVCLRNPKSNYSRKFAPTALVKSQDQGTEGTLRAASQAEAKALGVTPETATDLEAVVLDAVKNNPGLSSATQIAEVTGRRKASILAIVRKLTASGELLKTSDGFQAVPSGSGSSRGND